MKSIHSILLDLKRKYPDDQQVKSLEQEITKMLDRENSPGFQSDQEKHRKMIMENLPGMDIFLFDRQLKVLYAAGSEKLQKSFNPQNIIGQKVTDIFEETTGTRLTPVYHSIISGNYRNDEIPYNGSIFKLIGYPIRNKEKEIVAGLSIIYNITLQKEDEKKLRDSKNSAVDSEKSNSLFLATMSHEIRTPLNTIIGFAAQLAKSELNTTQDRYINLIKQSSEHLLNVVNELQIIFKLGQGNLFIDEVPFHLRSLLKEITDLFQLEARNKELKLSSRISGDVHKYLLGDPYRMKQILINIVGNAIKFTDEGSVRIFCKPESSKKNSIMLRLEVVDTGIGIPPEDLPGIFNEFKQADNLERKRRGGTGLGLTISKKLVELMGGSIQVESKLGKGTRFIIFIPFKKSLKKTAFSVSKKYHLEDKDLKGKSVLLADDDEQNLLLSETIFREWGMKFEGAKNGIEALQKSEEKKYDVLLLDIHMPGITGQHLVRKIRNDQNNPNQNSRILTMTANIMKSDLKSYLMDGFEDFILKPYREEDLYNKLCLVLDVPRKRRRKLKIKKTAIMKDFSRPELLDLTELKKTSRGDKEFENKMIRSFIVNTESSLQRIKKCLARKDYICIGEAAHKMTSSFRYFKLKPFVHNLEEMEEFCMTSDNPEKAEPLILNTIEMTEALLQKLKNNHKMT